MYTDRDHFSFFFFINVHVILFLLYIFSLKFTFIQRRFSWIILCLKSQRLYKTVILTLVGLCMYMVYKKTHKCKQFQRQSVCTCVYTFARLTFTSLLYITYMHIYSHRSRYKVNLFIYTPAELEYRRRMFRMLLLPVIIGGHWEPRPLNPSV